MKDFVHLLNNADEDSGKKRGYSRREKRYNNGYCPVQNYDGKGYDHEIGENEIARETAEIISH